MTRRDLGTDAHNKAEMEHWNSNCLMHVHCIIHQEAFCIHYELEIYRGFCLCQLQI